MKAILLLASLLLSLSAHGQAFTWMRPYVAAQASSSATLLPAYYWWIASEITNTGPVTNWYDHVNNFPLTQVSSGQRPDHQSNYVAFTGSGGSGQWVTNSSPTAFSDFSSAWSVAWIASHGVYGAPAFGDGLLGGEFNDAQIRYNLNGSVPAILAQSSFFVVPNASPWSTNDSINDVMIVALGSPASYVSYTNGVLCSSNFVGGTPIIGTRFSIGSTFFYTSAWFTGKVYEVSAYTNALTLTNAQAWHSRRTNLYGP